MMRCPREEVSFGVFLWRWRTFLTTWFNRFAAPRPVGPAPMTRTSTLLRSDISGLVVVEARWCPQASWVRTYLPWWKYFEGLCGVILLILQLFRLVTGPAQVFCRSVWDSWCSFPEEICTNSRGGLRKRGRGRGWEMILIDEGQHKFDGQGPTTRR